MSLFMTRFLMHVLQFEFIDTRVLVYACHLALILPLVGQLSDSPGATCPDPEAWTVVDSLLIRVRSGSVGS